MQARVFVAGKRQREQILRGCAFALGRDNFARRDDECRRQWLTVAQRLHGDRRVDLRQIACAARFLQSQVKDDPSLGAATRKRLRARSGHPLLAGEERKQAGCGGFVAGCFHGCIYRCARSRRLADDNELGDPLAGAGIFSRRETRLPAELAGFFSRTK